MSSAGGPKDLRRAFEKELLGQLWEGNVNAAIELLKGALEWVRNPTAMHTFNISLKYLSRNILCCKNIVEFTLDSDL